MDTPLYCREMRHYFQNKHIPILDNCFVRKTSEVIVNFNSTKFVELAFVRKTDEPFVWMKFVGTNRCTKNVRRNSLAVKLSKIR